MQKRVLERLGSPVQVAYHRIDGDAAQGSNRLGLYDQSVGDTLWVRATPSWSLRDVDSVRVDAQGDGTALVVLLLGRTERLASFLREVARGDGAGALVLDGQLFRAAGFGLYATGGPIPYPIGPMDVAHAATLAGQLNASLAR